MTYFLTRRSRGVGRSVLRVARQASRRLEIFLLFLFSSLRPFLSGFLSLFFLRVELDIVCTTVPPNKLLLLYFDLIYVYVSCVVKVGDGAKQASNCVMCVCV